ncbi:GNAT family N-acetyltransferase [Streptomyces sp. NPDC002825]|uniref:GNAT family N-acetyltransferase n=1 Tax=Streptomyces sp. NPDC002825 TaxID=3154666 RepID=UPI00331E0CB7
MKPDIGAPAVSGPLPRAATPDDAAEIARLRSDFVLSEPLDAAWLAVCRAQIAARLRPGADARAFVVDGPAGGLVACALAFIQPVLPGPGYPRGLAARIHAVATEPAHRRRGLARAALAALLKQLEEDGVTLYELHASETAAPLYEEVGFRRDAALMLMTKAPALHRGEVGPRSTSDACCTPTPCSRTER